MLEVTNLFVSVADKRLIHGVSFTLSPGTIYAFMGPNGSGKSTLCNALMGDPALKLKGSIKVNGKELIKAKANERAKAGIFLAFQNPEEIEGVKASNLIRKANSNSRSIDEMVKEHEGIVRIGKSLGMDESFVSRELNVGFSGGEKKRMEMLQLLALNPKVVIMDEIDSGLDVDGLKLIAKSIKKLNDDTRCFLIVTHYPRILKYIKPDVVCVLVNGKIVEKGNSKLAGKIEKNGYKNYLKSRDGVKNVKHVKHK